MTVELSPEAADLAAATTAWTDQWWDPDVGLVWMPPDQPADGSPTPAPGLHLLPQTAWYAVGLLLRDGPGDRASALQAIAAVLDHQYDAPGQVWHGTFSLLHESAEPRPGAQIWVDYDPNWRQFIGCTLLLALEQFPGALPPDLVARIDAALALAVEGEPHDRIADNYSNIALMHSYLTTEAGHRLGRDEWIADGEDRGRRVVALFDRFGAFDEYNSPTYYGIDLKALGLWRGHSSSAVLTALGTRVERALWLDAADWYHPGLRNMAGPYTRAYGMDMEHYVAAWSPWIWAALGREHAPLPAFDGPLDHGMDVMLGAVVALIGSVVPEEAAASIRAFRGEHRASHRLADADHGDRVASAWLGETAMLGVEQSTVDLSWWDQFHGATAHWRRRDGSLGWLRAVVPGRPDTTLEPGRLTIRWHHGEAAEGIVARFVLDRPIAGDPWSFDGLTLAIDDGPPTTVVDGRELRVGPGPGATTTFVITPS